MGYKRYEPERPCASGIDEEDIKNAAGDWRA